MTKKKSERPAAPDEVLLEEPAPRETEPVLEEEDELVVEEEDEPVLEEEDEPLVDEPPPATSPERARRATADPPHVRKAARPTPLEKVRAWMDRPLDKP
jgi:hypothetical protein